MNKQNDVSQPKGMLVRLNTPNRVDDAKRSHPQNSVIILRRRNGLATNFLGLKSGRGFIMP